MLVQKIEIPGNNSCRYFSLQESIQQFLSLFVGQSGLKKHLGKIFHKEGLNVQNFNKKSSQKLDQSVQQPPLI